MKASHPKGMPLYFEHCAASQIIVIIFIILPDVFEHHQSNILTNAPSANAKHLRPHCSSFSGVGVKADGPALWAAYMVQGSGHLDLVRPRGTCSTKGCGWRCLKTSCSP
jgi:hypothetical protein